MTTPSLVNRRQRYVIFKAWHGPQYRLSEQAKCWSSRKQHQDSCCGGKYWDNYVTTSKFAKVDHTDCTSDDVPQRPTTKQMSALSPEVHHKRSTLLTPISLVACVTKVESKRLQWERGRSEDATFEKYKPWMHPGGIHDRLGNIFNYLNTRNIFTESVAPFYDTLLKRCKVTKCYVVSILTKWQTYRAETIECSKCTTCYLDEMVKSEVLTLLTHSAEYYNNLSSVYKTLQR